MAQIVAAVACAHTPMMAVKPDLDAAGLKERVFGGLREARARLDAARPDALILVSNEHLQSWFFHNWPSLALAYGEEMPGPIERWMPMPRYTLPGNVALGRYLAEAAMEAHFDPATAQEFEPDHGVMLPLHHLRPEMDLPTVLVMQNCVEPPMPTLRRCQQFGRFLGQAIAGWPVDAR